MLTSFVPGTRMRFAYRNHRDEYDMRDVVLLAVDFGANEWYPTPQWFIRCYDPSRKAERSFALANISSIQLNYGSGKPPTRFDRFMGFGSIEHRQIYWAWRIFRKGMIHTMLVGAMAGTVVTSWVWLLARLANG